MTLYDERYIKRTFFFARCSTTASPLQWDTVEENEGGFTLPTVSDTEIEVPEPGTYRVVGMCQVTSGNEGVASLRVNDVIKDTKTGDGGLSGDVPIPMQMVETIETPSTERISMRCSNMRSGSTFNSIYIERLK